MAKGKFTIVGYGIGSLTKRGIGAVSSILSFRYPELLACLGHLPLQMPKRQGRPTNLLRLRHPMAALGR